MFDDPHREFLPVKNDEDQYALWPADRPPPDGWTAAGPKGDKTSCLAFIEANWVDMRPASLRIRMAQDR
jgi:MbtH protein